MPRHPDLIGLLRWIATTLVAPLRRIAAYTGYIRNMCAHLAKLWLCHFEDKVIYKVQSVQIPNGWDNQDTPYSVIFFMLRTAGVSLIGKAIIKKSRREVSPVVSPYEGINQRNPKCFLCTISL